MKTSNGPDGPKEMCFECNHDCNLIQMHVHPDDAYPACAIQIGKLSYCTGLSAVRQRISSSSPDRAYLWSRATAIISAASKMFSQ